VYNPLALKANEMAEAVFQPMGPLVSSRAETKTSCARERERERERGREGERQRWKR